MTMSNTRPSRKFANSKSSHSHSQHEFLTERIRQRVTERLIAEHYANVILEVIDKDELQKATSVLKKLGTIKAAADKDPAFSVLSDAIKTASAEVNEFTGGGLGSLLKKGVGALTKKLGIKADTNPILKSLTLLNALETGFDQLVDVIKNNVPDYDESKGPLSDQAPDEKSKKLLQKNIVKIFEPEGIFGKIKSLFTQGQMGIPYVEDAKLLVAGVMSSSPENLSAVIQAAKSGGSSSDVAGDAVQSIVKSSSGKGEEGARTVEKSSTPQTVKSVDDLAKAIAAGQSTEKKKDPEEAVKAATEDPKKFTQQFVGWVANKSGQKPDDVAKIITALIKAGKLKTEYKLATESRQRMTSTLTLKDVNRAWNLFLESGGSSQHWIDLLAEVEIPKDVEEKLKTPGTDATSNYKIDLQKALSNLRDDTLSVDDEEIIQKHFKDNELEKNAIGLIKKSKDAAISKKGAKDFDDLNPEKALKLAKDQKLDLSDRKGIMTLASTLKSQYGVDLKKAKEFIDNKVVPLIKGSTNKENPLQRFKDKISAVKSLEDLVVMMNKINSKVGKKVEYKSQDDGKKLDIGQQMDHLKTILKDPSRSKELIKSIVNDGGLRDKVKELLASSGSGEVKSTSEKHAKVIDAIKDSLKDISSTTIFAVLNVLPEYLMAESIRRNLSESHRRANLT